MNDNELERWAEIFRANRIDLVLPGVTFYKFLQNPNGYLEAAIFNMPEAIADDDSFYPLLPAQRRVAIRLDVRQEFQDHYAALESELTGGAIRHRGNRYVEPIRHHSYAVSGDRDNRRPPR